MNRSEAISIVRRRGTSSVTPASFHFANVNAAKNVWWLDIPVTKLTQSGDSNIGLLLYDDRPSLLHVLEVPKSYFKDHVRDLVVRQEKGCISLELSTERAKMFRDVRPTGGGVSFGQFLTDTIS
jgi:hypothetical protein